MPEARQLYITTLPQGSQISRTVLLSLLYSEAQASSSLSAPHCHQRPCVCLTQYQRPVHSHSCLQDESCMASHLGERAPREEQEPEAADVHSHAQTNGDAAAATAADAGNGASSALEAFLEGGADPVGLDRCCCDDGLNVAVFMSADATQAITT